MADLSTILGSITIVLIMSLEAFCIIFCTIMSTAYENLKQLLEVAIRRQRKSGKCRADWTGGPAHRSSELYAIQMNPTEIKAAREGTLKATSQTTFSPRDKALLKSLLHTIDLSVLACPKQPESSSTPTASATKS